MPPVLTDWVLPISGTLGLWLTSCPGRRLSHRVVHGLGYALGLVGQPIWLIWTWQHIAETPGPFVTSALFTWAWASGLWRNLRGE